MPCRSKPDMCLSVSEATCKSSQVLMQSQCVSMSSVPDLCHFHLEQIHYVDQGIQVTLCSIHDRITSQPPGTVSSDH